MVAVSSCKAEYMSTSHCTKEALWLRNLLECLDLPQRDATILYCNNQGTISLTKDATFHVCSKQINVAHHFIQECVEMDQIVFKYLPTHKMPADALTKSVAGPTLTKFRKIMGVQEKGSGDSLD
jgi:hypothetical protein